MSTAQAGATSLWKNEHSSSRRCPFSLILPTPKRPTTESMNQHRHRYVRWSLQIERYRGRRECLKGDHWVADRTKSLSSSDASNVGAYAEITAMDPALVRILIDIRRGETNKTVPRKTEMRCEQLFRLHAWGFHRSENRSKIWCNVLLWLIQMNTTRFR